MCFHKDPHYGLWIGDLSLTRIGNESNEMLIPVMYTSLSKAATTSERDEISNEIYNQEPWSAVRDVPKGTEHFFVVCCFLILVPPGAVGDIRCLFTVVLIRRIGSVLHPGGSSVKYYSCRTNLAPLHRKQYFFSSFEHTQKHLSLPLYWISVELYFVGWKHVL